MQVICPTCGGRAPRCPTCLEQAFGWARSTAAVRGELWGRSVWRRAPGRRWPADDDLRMGAIAVTKVQDLAGDDAELLERLVRVCIDAARAEYNRPTPRIGTTDVYD